MREFVWPCSEDELDVPLNLTSGQVFRWRESSGGEWSGVDGEHVYTLRREAEGVRVRTTGTPEDFIRLFRLEVSLAAVRSEIVRLGPELAPYANGFSGLRLMRPSCPREVLFCFLCSANNHISRITSMVG
ncbi:MAG TPA: DNA glycosylase, partial [Fimbriimonadaceae bacterium]|nr:DNA glycosylase [Fimbriimonadaceae bacterium]